MRRTGLTQAAGPASRTGPGLPHRTNRSTARGTPGDALDRADGVGRPELRDRLDDSILVARAGEGDDDAFAVLVHRHTSPLLALAGRLLGNPSDAEEAVQDSLVSAWRRLPEFRGDAAFRTWMYRIVTNRCLTVLRRRTPTTPLDSVTEPASRDAAGQPMRAAETAAATEALTDALGELTPDQRACWVLRELHELSYEEIAEVTGASEQSVRGRLFRARRALTKEMAPWR